MQTLPVWSDSLGTIYRLIVKATIKQSLLTGIGQFTGDYIYPTESYETLSKDIKVSELKLQPFYFRYINYPCRVLWLKITNLFSNFLEKKFQVKDCSFKDILRFKNTIYFHNFSKLFCFQFNLVNGIENIIIFVISHDVTYVSQRLGSNFPLNGNTPSCLMESVLIPAV